ncbi:MAG TPA: hypothetical protein PKE57_01605 [Cellvibrionaceae bacterium]|nr:hypothetical protein [Cellvibrionaceae bacterium]HNG60960.1 hypothetical protein [Cellvibrionaceae bacterium]
MSTQKPLPFTLTLLGSLLLAQLSHAHSVDEVVVTGVKERLYAAGMLKDSIEKTEVVAAESMIRNRRTTSPKPLLNPPACG